MFTVTPYSPESKADWDAFVASSRNGTFLLRRDYMDYHADRFTDASLMIREADRNRLVGVFAASRHGSEIRAHGGLTYGGLLLSPSHSSATDVLGQMEAVCAHYRAEGCDAMLYKPVPHIFHTYPAEEDLYALFRLGAQVSEVNISSTVDLNAPLKFDTNSRRNLSAAGKNGLSVEFSTDLSTFWQILGEVLATRHGAAPVHTLDEITLLSSRFPDEIRLASVMEGSTMVAGALLYVTPTAVHTQYIASSPRGREAGALALLFQTLIDTYAADGKRWLDFGTSNEDHGLTLNPGLLRQKHGFGARGIAFPAYRLEL